MTTIDTFCRHIENDARNIRDAKKSLNAGIWPIDLEQIVSDCGCRLIEAEDILKSPDEPEAYRASVRSRTRDNLRRSVELLKKWRPQW